MSDSPPCDKTLALAGIYQAAALARQLARRGHADEQPLETSVRSVLIVDAINTASIFGGSRGVRLGLLAIGRQAGSPGDLEVAKYVVSLCQLADRFGRSPESIKRVSQELLAIQEDVSVHPGEGFSAELYERFAELYKDTFSGLKPRIVVQGEKACLNNPHIVAQIRTALLAGVRAGVLFAQLGGSRWQLLLRRRLYRDRALHLLEQIGTHETERTLH